MKTISINEVSVLIEKHELQIAYLEAIKEMYKRRDRYNECINQFIDTFPELSSKYKKKVYIANMAIKRLIKKYNKI